MIEKYRDRNHAAMELIKHLRHYQGQQGTVKAIPRGGVPLGHPIAEALGFELDIALIKKIGHPQNKELAIGAVSLRDRVVNPDLEMEEDYIEEETRALREKLRQNREEFAKERGEEVSVRDKIVIITDDGIATGNTMKATIQLLRKEKPRRIVVAVPVASPRSVRQMKAEVNEFICPLQPSDFQAVGQFYENFGQVSNQEVTEILAA